MREFFYSFPLLADQIEHIYSLFILNPLICTDSRHVEQNSLFFALKGDNFDGNEYATQALADGSSFAVIDDPSAGEGEQYILVDNVLATLQQLATHHRDQIDIPVICVTGTNGKTTTKELMAKVLEKKYKVVATKGNFNNHLGVPLSILSIGQEAEIAVIELGANHIGEIEMLCKIAKPSHGLITNIGKAHLLGFGDVEGVKKAKSELYKYLQSVDGCVFVNTDNSILVELTKDIDTVTYGTSADVNYQGALLSSNDYLQLTFNKQAETPKAINSRLIGAYNFENILAAVSVGLYFEIPEDDISSAIESYVPDNSRSQEINTESNHIIMDAYNANPMNMRAALESFANNAGDKSMVILGDMLELGTHAAEEHKSIVEYLRAQSFDRVILIGEEFSKAYSMLRCEHFANVNDAKMWLLSSPASGMNILIKGSRGIGLEEILEAL